MKEIEDLISRLKSDNEWGTYFLRRYYFTINTRKSRSDYGINKPKQELSKESQLKLQKEHFPALFHEYIHYLHELSTVIGNMCLSLDLSSKAIFSNWLDGNSKSSESKGLQKEYVKKYSKAIITQDVLFGSFHNAIEGKFIEVVKVSYQSQPVYFPSGDDFEEYQLDIPKVSFKQLSTNNHITTQALFFGRYFIYEGLAYELDRIVHQQVEQLDKIDDNAKGSEYTVLRKIAQFIFPNIDKRTYLSVGVLALQYANCGAMFIKMIEKVKYEVGNGRSQVDFTNELKKEVSLLLKQKKKNFFEAQDEYVDIFKNRHNLQKSFLYLTKQTKQLYEYRIENPCFEVDYVFENRYIDILNLAPICDYMYLFNDYTDFMRDFLGTSIDRDTSMALKTVVCYDHYYSSHKITKTAEVEKEEHSCPFFKCCDLSIRKEHSNTCKSKPWRVYEIAVNSDNQHCWYGTGVLEFKGYSKPK